MVPAKQEIFENNTHNNLGMKQAVKCCILWMAVMHEQK
jgi:hypothetical protein